MTLTPALVDVRAVLLQGDCVHLSTLLAPNTVDAIVTDPPAGISFMGKSWDGDKGGRDQWIAWLAERMRVALTVLKPGGHILCWAIPRTSHWTATALEVAGFEIRDVVMAIFGSGFPKSLTSKSADIPASTGTALKPAAEHWILARKPLDGTVAENFAKHGTGLLQIEACRVEYGASGPPAVTYSGAKGEAAGQVYGSSGKYASNVSDAGRWPAHVTFDEEAAADLDAQAGREVSRFFYCPKAPRREKDAGLDHLPVRSGGEATDREEGSAGLKNPRAGAGRTGGARNHHPTVKSIALMRWLCRLITPPGGTVLDMFAGSATTALGALAEGFNFIGTELDRDDDGKPLGYIDIASGRIRHALAEGAE